jgi:predicted ATPase
VDASAYAFLREVSLRSNEVPDFGQYPFSIPSVKKLGTLEFHRGVTFFIGENGSGKSTLIEAIAVAAGFNAEGGSRHLNFSTRSSESELHRYLRLVRGVRRPATGYFLRAESFFNVATEVDKNPDALESHGGRSLHELSHGEAFLQLVEHRFFDDGLYILDEPEAALSPQRQLGLLRAIDDLVRSRSSQFVISTHSPLLMAYPDARIYLLDGNGIAPIEYEATEHYALTKDFLNNRERYLHQLFADRPASKKVWRPRKRRALRRKRS